MVGSRLSKNKLSLRKTRLLATDTIPAGTQVEMLFVRALTTGNVATELLLSLLESSSECLRSSERRQKILLGQVLWLGECLRRSESV